MQIILISQKNRKTFQLSLTRGKLLTVLSSIALLLGVVFYTWGLSKGEALINNASAIEVSETLNAQQEEIKRLQTKSKNTLDGIALRVGQMQAEITRLNAVGEHLAKKAKLDIAEFDFNVIPARGGVELTEPTTSFGESELLNEIQELEELISVRQQQLEMLDIFSSDKILSKTSRPAGLPVEKGWLSSHFGYRADPFSGKRTFHHGVDIAGKSGTNVVAVAAGIVTFSGDMSGYGNMIEIDHGKGYVTRYGHNKENLIKSGSLVKQGDIIAKMGSTGRSTGPHVHFEVIKNGKKINPRKFLYAAR